jgi:RNA polymerase sigma-70 factor (ECF subfamily)
MAPKSTTAASSIHGTRFESCVVIHLDSAYNLARWLTRDERNAEDLVQEACLRAFKFLETFRGGNSRAWFLAIVRNTYYSDRKKNRGQALNVPFNEDGLDDDDSTNDFWAVGDSEDPVRGVEREEAKRLVHEALDALPEEFREVIVLRELEDLSYQEIARIMQIPLGTVMSRLSRARKLLYRAVQRMQQEPKH